MAKLHTVNFVVALILLLAAGSSSKETITMINEYGWEYNRTIIIGDERREETILGKTELLAGGFIGLISVLLLYNNSAMGTPRHKILFEERPAGILFPEGDPETWDIWYDRKNEVIGVSLDKLSIIFPLSLIYDGVGGTTLPLKVIEGD